MDNRYTDGVLGHPDTKDISTETLDANLRRVAQIERGLGNPATAATVEAHVKPFIIPRHSA